MLPIYVPIAVLLIVGFLNPLIGIKFKLFRRILVSATILFTFLFWLFLSPQVFSGEIITCNLTGWTPPFGINLVLDSLSLTILLLITGIGFLISLVIEKFIHERRSEFYCLFVLMLVGMSGIVLTGDLFNMFVFTEILVISSYALTIFYRDSKSVEAGFKYLLIGSLGTVLILLGIAMIYGLTGTLNIADLMTKVSLINIS